MITFSQKGSFKNLEAFLRRMQKGDLFTQLDILAKQGVEALRANTPIDSGTTALGWYYEIKIEKHQSTITWFNSHIVDGQPIAILLQYGHGTGTGGYVQGRDYINPALKPIFDIIEDKVWKAVTSA